MREILRLLYFTVMTDPSSNIYPYQEEDHDYEQYRHNHYVHFASLSPVTEETKMVVLDNSEQSPSSERFQPIKMQSKENGIGNGENYDNDDDPDVNVDALLASSDTLTNEPSSHVPENHKVVRSIDILQYLINSLAGKDKLAKILKYSLDLLRLLIHKSRNSMTKWDPTILVYYKKVLKDLNFNMLLKHPITIIKVLLVAIFENFESKADFVSQQLSLYRYILRFGGTPFRLVKMFQKVQKSQFDVEKIERIWFNEASLTDFFDLYYGICDEMVLLHKLKVWSHPGLYSWFSRHESISWQYDILLNLKNNWLQLQSIQTKILELQIQSQVRTRALKLSANLQGSSGYSSPIRKQLLRDLNNGNEWNGNDIEIKQRLDQLKDEKFIAYLDMTRLTFDCLANSTDIFNLKVPPGTYGILSLSSGFTGLIKLWINARKELSK